MENNSVWDEKQLEKLKKLWDEGLPITKIGIINWWRVIHRAR